MYQQSRCDDLWDEMCWQCEAELAYADAKDSRVNTAKTKGAEPMKLSLADDLEKLDRVLAETRDVAATGDILIAHERRDHLLRALTEAEKVLRNTYRHLFDATSVDRRPKTYA